MYKTLVNYFKKRNYFLVSYVAKYNVSYDVGTPNEIEKPLEFYNSIPLFVVDESQALDILKKRYKKEAEVTILKFVKK